MAHARHAYGPLVRGLREARGLTLAQLSERSGYSGGYLSRIEREDGRKASPEATSWIARALGVEVPALTGQLPPYRAVRQAMGISSLKQFAEEVGLSVDEMHQIELGLAAPDGETLQRIARRLGVPVRTLLLWVSTES